MHILIGIQSERLMRFQRMYFHTYRCRTASPPLPARIFLKSPVLLVHCNRGQGVQSVLLVVLLKELQDNLQIRLSLLKILIRQKRQKSKSGLEFITNYNIKGGLKAITAICPLFTITNEQESPCSLGGLDKTDFEVLKCPGSYYTSTQERAFCIMADVFCTLGLQ